MPEITAKYTRVYAKTAASKKRIVINVGGARSSKSYSVAQLLVIRFLTERKKTILISRKTFPALRATAMHTVIELLKDWGVYSPENHNKTEHSIIEPRLGNIIRFISVDDPTRIRSMECNYAWLEEANEFTFEDFVTIRTRMSSPTTAEHRNQMFLTLNPSDSYGWINQRLVNASQDEAVEDHGEVETIYSSYKDNPALSQDYIRTLEQLKDEDDTFYKIFALGVWAQSGSIIYSNYDIVPYESFPTNFDESFGGLDFGFNNPASAVFVGIKDGVPWIKEILYRSHLTNSDLIVAVKQECPLWRSLIWRADESEPDRIQEFSNAGFKIEPAKKGPNSVRDGIDFCKRKKWRISNDSVNVIKEVRGYKWREKDGLILDEPVKFMDHSMDAIRYALTGLKEFGKPQAIGNHESSAQVSRNKSRGFGSRYGNTRY